MSIVKAWDVAFVRFNVPDRALMRSFLLDFGMTEAAFPGDNLFMAGEESPFLYVAQPGPPGFASFGIAVPSADDLHRLADSEGATVEPLNAPGGGRVVRLTDPDGFVVEAVSGQAWGSPPAGHPTGWNEDGVAHRVGAVRRVAKGPSHVRRLGHVVLAVSDFRRSEAWYKDRFGLLTSDEIQPAPGVAIGAFLRCDRGDQPCDHHTVFLLQRPGPAGFMHAAFEVAGVDDLMAGHDHLLAAGHKPLWGVGRHHLGSQIFDYWLDPYGHEVEHWTDGDRLTAADGGSVGSIEELMGVQWGMPMPPLPTP